MNQHFFVSRYQGRKEIKTRGTESYLIASQFIVNRSYFRIQVEKQLERIILYSFCVALLFYYITSAGTKDC